MKHLLNVLNKLNKVASLYLANIKNTFNGKEIERRKKNIVFLLLLRDTFVKCQRASTTDSLLRDVASHSLVDDTFSEWKHMHNFYILRLAGN